MIFRKRYNYRFGDIDHAGIAYYPSLLHYFHVAMEDWWEEGLGRPYPALLIEDNYGMPAVKLEAEFFAPISYGDKPEICVGVLAVGNKSVELGFWMELGDGEVACKARVKTVGVAMDSLSGVVVPERWREAFADWMLSDADFDKLGR